jgi:hypothetical protein
MEYRGITFDIKISIERGEWVWVIHTPKPRQGKSIGSRSFAVRLAMKAIDAWCVSNPHDGNRDVNVG